MLNQMGAMFRGASGGGPGGGGSPGGSPTPGGQVGGVQGPPPQGPGGLGGVQGPSPGPMQMPNMGMGTGGPGANIEMKINDLQRQLQQASMELGQAQDRAQYYPDQQGVAAQAQMKIQMLQMQLQEAMVEKQQYEAEAQARLMQEEQMKLTGGGPMTSSAAAGQGGGGSGQSMIGQFASQFGAGQEKKFGV